MLRVVQRRDLRRTKFQTLVWSCKRNNHNDQKASAFWESRAGKPIRVGIVGSGPAGFYTAHALLQQSTFPNVSMHIDIIDRLPIGSGLVRSGVAPDHPEVKNVQNRFQDFLTEFSSGSSNPNKLNFYGNIVVGQQESPTSTSIHITADQLRSCYNVVVFVS
jgi:NADPH-dependent glutamate synthase beta subunit-like oxidoreductase